MMTEENKFANKLISKNQLEGDNRLLYEPPALRRHGKVGNVTQTILVAEPFFDSNFGPNYADAS